MQPTIETLKLKGVGPAAEMDFDFGPRLNLFTGDNGLGKTFLLDVVWWALTRTWPANPALPFDQDEAPEIEFSLQGISKPIDSTTVFNASTQEWTYVKGRPVNYGLVIYARADGGFSVWDHARKYLYPKLFEEFMGDEWWSEPFHFSPKTLWNGLEKDGKVVCNGLLRDWVYWQLKQSPEFNRLTDVLDRLKPEEFDTWKIGEPGRFSPYDARDIPTMELPYGRIPITHCSAGVRRILGFSYLLVWALFEHRSTVKLSKQTPTDRLIVLFDEIEAHLHPRWQRLFLPTLIDILDGEGAVSNRQLIVATHSPLVTASMETKFDNDLDRLFVFELEGAEVSAKEIPWSKQGDVVNWLVSDSFGLHQARSLESEKAIDSAQRWMRGDRDNLPAGMRTRDEIHQELLRVLADHDPFWPRWIVFDKENKA